MKPENNSREAGLPPETSFSQPDAAAGGGAADSTQTPGDIIRAPLKDWLFTLPFLLSFAAIFTVFDLAQRISLAISRRTHERCILFANRCLKAALIITGARIQIDGRERAARAGLNVPLVVISNHQSLFDIPIIHCLFSHKYPRFIAKVELSRWIPTVSFNLKHGENAVIDRSNPRQAIREITRLGERMRERKFAGVIFPEGTRAKDGKLKTFKKAGLSTLLSTVPEAMVIPLAIDGSWRLGAFRCRPVPYGVRVAVAVGEPFLIAGQSAEQVMERCYQFTKGKIIEMRSKEL